MSELVEATGETAEALSQALMDADAKTAAEAVTRGFSGLALSGAFVLGGGIGAATGYFVCKRMLETKYNQIAAEEIAEMRQHYNDKAIALEGSATKPTVEALVRDKGYIAEESSRPPMAVSPPSAVTEAAEEAAQDDKPKKVRVEVDGAPIEESETQPEIRNVFRDNEPPPDTWDAAKERARRSPRRPYVIHIDERQERDAYEGVTYTYYEDDDVLANETDDAMDEEERERIVGEANLERFGHGSMDANIVYIRNDQLEMDIEVVRSPNSFQEEVHGFAPEIKHSDRRKGRRPFDDE